MDWSILSLEDFHFLKDCLQDSSLEGSDSSLVGLFLLQKKYDTKTAIQNGFLFRYYTGSENRTGYGFPLRLCDQKFPNHDLKEAITLIAEDAKEKNRPVKFCLFTESQKNSVDSIIKSEFPELVLNWETNRDDCDYIYSRENLAALKGKTYHKKKNHVSRFLRTYEGNWEFRSLNLCQIADDMIFVAEKWLQERYASVDSEKMTDEEKKEREILNLEHEMIKTALQNKEDFALDGGVLYVKGEPVAMTLASRISEKVLDVHFEKCLSDAAQNGAYAAINWCFASSCDSYEFLNREEDMGVEGLRKAKLSYHPDLLLEKFYTTCHSELACRQTGEGGAPC